jgi:hypothetical protein
MASSHLNCKLPPKQDLSGQRFGYWTVLEWDALATCGKRYWICRCDCGQIRSIVANTLFSGKSRSCGCSHYTRGRLSGTPEYNIWRAMINRCYRSTTNHFNHYGGRGICVCERYRNSFRAFLDDLGDRPRPGLSLDRINTLGNYSCGKCEQCQQNHWPCNIRWATSEQQVRNYASNLWFTHNGTTMILKDWAAHVGIKYSTLYKRVKDGWEFSRAISQEIR